jgi:hypothetical protein
MRKFELAGCDIEIGRTLVRALTIDDVVHGLEPRDVRLLAYAVPRHGLTPYPTPTDYVILTVEDGAEVEGLDGIPRKMTDDAYKNRLLQYVREQLGRHKNGAILQAIINDLGARLNALDALAGKGVHADTSLAEARTCVMQTYLLAGDLLSIAVGESTLLSDDAEEANASESTTRPRP